MRRCDNCATVSNSNSGSRFSPIKSDIACHGRKVMYTFTSMEDLRKLIEEAWENKALLSESNVISAISEVMSFLDSGQLRCAEPNREGDWKVNDWIKKAVILNFPIQKWKQLKWGLLSSTTRCLLRLDMLKLV